MADKSDESRNEPTSTPKKAAAPRPAAEKTVAKTAAPKKAAATKKKAPKKTSSNATLAGKPEVKNKRSGESGGRRTDDKVMPGLLENLHGVFDKIHHDKRDQDQARDNLAKDLSGHLQQAFNTMHEELEEREKLLEQKLKSIDSSHNFEMQRVKLLSIPLMILTVVAIVYLFYVVSVMETAMTSMSQDMRQMTGYMAAVTDNTHTLSANTGAMVDSVNAMNTEIGQMNGNVRNLTTTVNNMSIDVHQLSRSVSPAMQGVNRFMP
jgi:uncharacterized protein YoxC